MINKMKTKTNRERTNKQNKNNKYFHVFFYCVHNCKRL